MIERVFVADMQLSRDDVLELARLVDLELAERLHRAVDRDVKVLGLNVPERETILRALDDPPEGLLELRAVLLQEQIARARGSGA
jgi:hypothetical protein